MKPWPIITLLLLSQQPALLAQDVGVLENKGTRALKDGVWEAAEIHFREALAAPKITPQVKARITLRLAETLIRAAKEEEALLLLASPAVAKETDTLFWKAQAIAGQHRFAEAVELLSEYLNQKGGSYSKEAGFTLASLQLALNRPDAALQALDLILPSANAATAVIIRLHKVEILLDQKRTEEARAAMPKAASIPESLDQLAEFLNAQILYQEDKFTEAARAFQNLVSQPQGQTSAHFHAAVMGLADSIYHSGDPEGASRSLLTFIQEHPESPALDAMFSRLLDWLPEKPALSDPVLARVSQWITPTSIPVTSHIAKGEGNAEEAWPSGSENTSVSNRLVQSLYTKAVGLHRVGTPEATAEAKGLLLRVTTSYPSHPLAGRALYQQARWLLDEGSVERALSILSSIRDASFSAELKGEAAFAEARVAYEAGDFTKAASLFDAASAGLETSRAKTARIQAAIIRFRNGLGADAKSVQQENASPADPTLEADLQLEQAMAATPPEAAKTALMEFLEKYPDHPRAAEARMVAAESALLGAAPDPAFAISQLNRLNSEQLEDSGITPLRVELARLRAVDVSNDPAATIQTAQLLIAAYPDNPDAAEASLVLGRALFNTGSYNQARLVLEALAARDTDSERAQVAWLLAARSAALGGTPQSKEQAIGLFDKATVGNSPVTSLATLEKARLLIDLRQIEVAIDLLKKWSATLPSDDPLHLPAGLLLGDALSQGSNGTDSLLEALAIYDKLLVHAQVHPALLNRLQYLRGSILEQLPDEKDPSKKREGLALQAYYSVLEVEGTPPEWEFFNLCGLRALALLEKSERWEAAISVAKKIAAFEGPHSEEAANRARELQLQHFFWAD